MGPGDSLAVTVSVPEALQLELRDRTVDVPIWVDSGVEIVGVDVRIGFDGNIVQAMAPRPGPAFSAAAIQSNVGEHEVFVSMVTDSRPQQPGPQILLVIPMAPGPNADQDSFSTIEILHAAISGPDAEAFNIRTKDGNITITAEIIPGDVDFSGRRDILDVVAVLRHLVGTDPLGPLGIQAADLVNPGVPPDDPVDIQDAVAVFSIILGE
jgi:hypothetical protein